MGDAADPLRLTLHSCNVASGELSHPTQKFWILKYDGGVFL